MDKSQNKIALVKRIKNTAVQYKKDIVGKTFLVLFEGKSVEIIFKVENFLHLCGVDTKLQAKDFYKKALKNQLTEKEIIFSKTHPYPLAEIKTKNLSRALSLMKNEAFMITDITTQSHSYKIGTTDFQVVLCFDNQINASGQTVNNVLIPYSLRVEDINSNKYNNIYEIDFVLSKETGKKEYSFMEYGDIHKLSQYLKSHSIHDYNISVNPKAE